MRPDSPSFFPLLTLVILASLIVPAEVTDAQSRRTAERSSPLSYIPDLSGDWMPDNTRGGIGQSISLADPGGRLRGREPDVPYQPWALQQTLSQVPATGPDGRYEQTTDPFILFCEPMGVGRIYMMPTRTRFVQTPDTVYILYEQDEQFRVCDSAAIIPLIPTHPGGEIPLGGTKRDYFGS
jgi:hypothetical protein